MIAAIVLAVLVEQALDRREIVERRDDDLLAHRFRNARRIRHRRREIREPLRREAHEAVVAHAVIAALEFQDLVALHVGAGDAHRVKVGLGARRHESHLLGARHRRDDLLGEPDAMRIVDEERRAERDLLEHRRLDLRVGMTDQHRARPEQEVDVLVARHVPDVPALAARDHDIEGRIAERSGRQHLSGALGKLGLGSTALRLAHLGAPRVHVWTGDSVIAESLDWWRKQLKLRIAHGARLLDRVRCGAADNKLRKQPCPSSPSTA